MPDANMQAGAAIAAGIADGEFTAGDLELDGYLKKQPGGTGYILRLEFPVEFRENGNPVAVGEIQIARMKARGFRALGSIPDQMDQAFHMLEHCLRLPAQLSGVLGEGQLIDELDSVDFLRAIMVIERFFPRSRERQNSTKASRS